MTDPMLRRAHLLAAGLLDHHRVTDLDAMAALFHDMIGTDDDPEVVAGHHRMVIAALLELANDVLDEQPADPDAWLGERIRRFRDPQ